MNAPQHQEFDLLLSLHDYQSYVRFNYTYDSFVQSSKSASSIQMSTITYAVNGKQYVAVMTGEGQSGTAGLLAQVPGLKFPRGHNAIYVFALP